MLKRTLTAGLLAFAAVTCSAGTTQAAPVPQANPMHGSSAATPLRWHGGGFHHFGGFHRFHGFRPGVIVGGPVYYYGGGCAWLRHRALVTGSPYWWRRYRICRGW